MLSEIGIDYKFSMRHEGIVPGCMCVHIHVCEKGSGLQDACSPVSH